MYTLTLEAVLEKSNLVAAWEKVRENKGAGGTDFQDVEDFEASLDEELEKLRMEVLEGKYSPQPLLRVWMEKEGKKPRPLAIPAIRDRVLQTAVTFILTPVFEAEFEDCSFAYRKGRSVNQAVERILFLRNQGYHWVVDADIESFFDEIDHVVLMEEVEKLVPDEDILSLIRQWIACEIMEGGVITQFSEGIPQGSPLSPLLSNLYLDHLDEALLENNLRVVRFADDFLVLCKSREHAENALDLTEDVLSELRLKINAEKTRIVDFDTGFRFLGVQFIRSLAMKVKTEDDFSLPFEDELSEKWTEEYAVSFPETETEKSLSVPVSEEDEVSEDDEEIPHSGDPRLRTLYLLEHGTVLGKESERFTLKKKGRTVQEVPAIKVDQIMVFGNCQLTTQAMNFCLGESIPIYLLSGQGRFNGIVDSFSTDPVLLHRDQFQRAGDEKFCLGLAREFVRGKIENSRVILMRLARKRNADFLRQAAAHLKRTAAGIGETRNLDQLRGIEGSCARMYFGALSLLLPAEWNFVGRKRQPPPDPVNAMLSYGYTLLFYNIYSFVRARGLNPHVGYLHPLRAGHPALVSDLVEEFRAIVVDNLVVRLVLSEQVRVTDFTMPNAVTPQCRMSDETRRLFIRQFEAKLNAAITHPHTDKLMDYRRCIECQVQELTAVIRGRHSAYRPMVVR